MTNRFVGQHALVASAGKGLGKAVAKQLALSGATLAIVDDNEENLHKTLQEMTQLGIRKPIAIVADASNPMSVEDTISKVRQAFGKLDVVVLHTGEPPTGTFMQSDNDMWEQAFRAQLLSTVMMTRAVYPLLKEAGGGKLLTIASSSLKATIPGFMLSNTVRAAIGELMKSLSVEWAKDGILVNTIFPSRSVIERTASEEFAKAIMYFISSENTYMTGSTVQVDGTTFSCN